MVKAIHVEAKGKHLKYVWLTLLLICFNLAAAPQPQRQNVSLYTYHYMPPYVINSSEQIGLLYDIEQFFNTHQQIYYFKVSYIPRKRLNYLLNSNLFEGMVIGVNPIWFQDVNKTKYLWSEAFINDQDEIISHSNNPVEFDSKQALIGKSIGGIAGFRYHTVDTLVAEGLMTRIDTANESQLINMLLKKRFDCAIVSRATTIYYQQLLNTETSIYFSSNPHDTFTRHIFAPKRLQTEFDMVESLVKQLNADPLWQQKMRQYQTYLLPEAFETNSDAGQDTP